MRWQTNTRPRAEQYSYWREVVCEAFTPLRPTARGARDSWDREGLSGWVETHPFGAVNGAEIGTCDQTIHHGKAEIDRLEEGVAFVNLMLRGRSVVTQGGSMCLSGPGTFSIVDATRPFRLDYLDDWRAISFRIPIELIPDGVADADTAVRHATSRGLASVLADTMRAAWRAGTTLDDDQANSAGLAVVSLATALLRNSPATEFAADPVAGTVLRENIEHFVARHLQYGEVTPTAVAEHFGISVRKLHLLYEDRPATFGQTVMRLRAEQCAEDLLANPGGLTLTDLAAKWGFSDLSHLNRVFRRRFGCRASEYARQAPHVSAP